MFTFLAIILSCLIGFILLMFIQPWWLAILLAGLIAFPMGYCGGTLDFYFKNR